MAGISLYAPPVERRFLAGGPDTLALSLPAACVIVVTGTLALPLAASIPGLGLPAEAAVRFSSVAAATLSALLTAALCARWLGSRMGALAGLVQLTNLCVLTAVRRDAAEMLLCVATTVAMGAFALGNVPGRLRLVDRRWTRLTFYAAVGWTLWLAGPIPAASVLAGCVLFVVLCGDSRALRFLADPIAVALFALMVGLWLVYPADQWAVGVSPAGTSGDALGPPLSMGGALGRLALGTLPWTPLIVLAAIAGIRLGHVATPIWRLFGCWLAAPAAWMALAGGLRHERCLIALLPPLSAMGAAGLSALMITGRRALPR